MDEVPSGSLITCHLLLAYGHCIAQAHAMAQSALSGFGAILITNILLANESLLQYYCSEILVVLVLLEYSKAIRPFKTMAAFHRNDLGPVLQFEASYIEDRVVHCYIELSK